MLARTSILAIKLKREHLLLYFLFLRQYKYERDDELSQGLHNFSIPKKEEEKMT